MAASNGEWEVVKFLIENGGDYMDILGDEYISEELKLKVDDIVRDVIDLKFKFIQPSNSDL